MPKLDSLKLTGADILVRKLVEQGVDTVFCITGAGNLAIVDAIVRDGSIKIIYSHHEQSAVMEAQGYSRITNKVSVALVTTGGGVANTLTGVLSAYLDSIPVILISGNESSFHCENYENLRAYGVQGFDSVGVFKKITKIATRILDVNEITKVFDEAWSYSLNDRRGPVLIDFPMDLQRKVVETDETFIISMPKQSVGQENLDQEIIQKIDLLSKKINQAARPILYIGNGCRSNETMEILQKLIRKEKIPFALSWSALDLISSKHPLNIGRVGIYGDRATNILLQKSDLVISIGTRLAIPQVGYDKEDFGRNAEKWVVEIDPTECEKFKATNWNILNMNVSDFLQQFLKVREIENSTKNYAEWLTEIDNIWNSLPRMEQIGPEMASSLYVHSANVIKSINQQAEDNAVITTDVGAGLLTGHYVFEPDKNQRFFTSQGLGEMGFGLPSAIAAYFADKSRQLICLNTDGGIMFNLQELQVVKDHKIPIKLFVFNNDGYSMIRISQENLFAGRLAGSGTTSGIGFPEFENIAKTFGLKYLKVASKEKIDSTIEESFSMNAGVLIEVIMSPLQKYLPRLSTSKTNDGMLISPPIEDLDPLLSLDDLERYLGYKAHRNSYIARGIKYV
jgi:acetolactate synthase-1/2/3 large subunit